MIVSIYDIAVALVGNQNTGVNSGVGGWIALVLALIGGGVGVFYFIKLVIALIKKPASVVGK